MRVTTVFKRLLRLDGVRVVAVELDGEPGKERVVVDLVRPARRWLVCSRCGFRTRVGYDRSVRTLRHLDAPPPGRAAHALPGAPRGAPACLPRLRRGC